MHLVIVILHNVSFSVTLMILRDSIFYMSLSLSVKIFNHHVVEFLEKPVMKEVYILRYLIHNRTMLIPKLHNKAVVYQTY